MELKQPLIFFRIYFEDLWLPTLLNPQRNYYCSSPCAEIAKEPCYINRNFLNLDYISYLRILHLSCMASFNSIENLSNTVLKFLNSSNAFLS